MSTKQIEFQDLGLSAETLSAITEKGFVHPTPIQAATIPLLLQNEIDIVGQAQTGTGKTAAFGLPLIELLEEDAKRVQALILVPTRELALQVSKELSSFKGNKRLWISTVYGGQNILQQIKELRKGADIVVGTPGRIMDHLNRGTLKIDNISHVILDEADEMLNMGFVDDIKEILSTTPDDKRVLLFSATMPKEILNIAKNYMGEYELIAVKQQTLTTELTHQVYYEVSSRDRKNALVRIIDADSDFYGIVFCQTKRDADEINHFLVERGYNADALHGDVAQNQREKVLDLFRKKHLRIVVATDVAARGIDINNLTHVVNYSLPQEAETYVHRIGRTGRAGKKGIAISLVTPGESRKFSQILKVSKASIEKAFLPSAEDIVLKKINHFIEKLNDTIIEGGAEKHNKITQSLLELHNPEDVINALLKLNYNDAFDTTSYEKIQKARVDTRDGDRGGRDRDGRGRDRDGRDRDSRGSRGGYGDGVRLFFAQGKLDGMSPRKLVGIIEDDTNVRQRFIDDVKIMDKFSFFTVQPKDADKIVQYYKKSGKNNRPMVERAKD